MRAFVVGNGPSLNKNLEGNRERGHPLYGISHFDLLKNEVTFGVNRIHLIYDQTRWRPTHWVMMDFSNSLFYKEDIQLHSLVGYPCHIRSDIMAKFLEWCTDPALENLNIVEGCIHIDIERHTSDAWHEPVCQMGGSVPTAIQLAVQMGHNPIYTIGMDGNKKGNAENNFVSGYIHKDSVGVHKAIIANKTTALALSTADLECKSRGVSLIDITIGGSAYKSLPEESFYDLFD